MLAHIFQECSQLDFVELAIFVRIEFLENVIGRWRWRAHAVAAVSTLAARARPAFVTGRTEVTGTSAGPPAISLRTEIAGTSIGSTRRTSGIVEPRVASLPAFRPAFWAITGSARRRAILARRGPTEEFLTRQFAVAIFVQLQQRCRGVFDFVSVNDAVVI
jgi:hypothetical protein